MKLIQLRYLVAVAENDLNITQAARVLHAAQPGVSKQLKQLEDELGIRLFERKGRALVRPTDAGTKVIDRASQIVRQARSIKALASDLRKDDAGSLSIATGSSGIFAGLVRLPCYRWHRAIVVPQGHPLGDLTRPSFEDLAQYPLVTYSFSFSGPSSLIELFAQEGLTPNVALTAWDSDVIKKYVREGLGVGIIANVAIDGTEDGDLRVRDASHLFPVHTTWAGFRRGVLLRGYMVDFLQMLAPHLTQRLVQSVEGAGSQDDVDRAFAGVKIPYAR